MQVSNFDFNLIPNELGLHIFSFLSPLDIQIASLVNHLFNQWANDKCFEESRALFYGYDPKYCSQSYREYCEELKQETIDFYRDGLLPSEYIVCRIEDNRRILSVFQTLVKLKNCTVPGIYTYLFSSDQFAKIARCFAVFLESNIAQGNIQFPEFYTPLDKKFRGKALRQIRIGLSIRETNPYSSILFKLLLRFEPALTPKEKEIFIKVFQLRNSLILSNLKFAYQKEKDPLVKQDYAFLINAHNGNLDQMVHHLRNRAEINSPDDSDWTALHHAVFRGHLEIARFLIQKGANIECESISYKTPLQFAMKRNDPEIAELLVENGANVNVLEDDNRTPLHLAAYHGHQNLAKKLIEKGADVNALDQDENTPLLLALKQNHKEVAEWLLSCDVDVNIANHHKLTALHYAVNQDMQDIVKILIEKDVDVNAQSNNGATPLFFAVRLGNLPLVDLLLDYGADPNLPFKKRLYPWFEAALQGHLKIRDRLLALSPLQQDNIQIKLLLAIFEEDQTKVQAFLREGADLHIPCLEGNGSLPLHWAVYSQKISIVKLLLELGADKNAKGAGGNTALHFALNGLPESQEIVSLLIDKGVDLDLKNDQGQSAREKMAACNKS